MHGRTREILNLFERGFSQRAIAQRVGLTPGGVQKALARWLDADGHPRERNGTVGRCPGCGGKVYFPCRLCAVRRAKARDREAMV